MGKINTIQKNGLPYSYATTQFNLIDMNKKELRNKIKKLADEMSEDYITKASIEIENKIINSKEFIQSKTVFAYVSTSREVGTELIIKKALSMNKTVCVPRCLDAGNMQAVKINSFEELKPGKYGIPEPVGDEIVDADCIDLTVVPCVSAYVNGARLGHGAGYYDRFLQTYKATKLCPCFKKLLSDEIEMSEYDVYMDAVITD
ncbi:MAG: 5-formyltetrahydrofolate cyclo-ligase [Ruminococcus sp.]|nr:5-formyltetrahydrofolate cyclo-ligase [Candidatus Copronaster equi]